jgi:hypothetical protein
MRELKKSRGYFQRNEYPSIEPKDIGDLGYGENTTMGRYFLLKSVTRLQMHGYLNL